MRITYNFLQFDFIWVFFSFPFISFCFLFSTYILRFIVLNLMYSINDFTLILSVCTRSSFILFRLFSLTVFFSIYLVRYFVFFSIRTLIHFFLFWSKIKYPVQTFVFVWIDKLLSFDNIYLWFHIKRIILIFLTDLHSKFCFCLLDSMKNYGIHTYFWRMFVKISKNYNGNQCWTIKIINSIWNQWYLIIRY